MLPCSFKTSDSEESAAKEKRSLIDSSDSDSLASSPLRHRRGVARGKDFSRLKSPNERHLSQTETKDSGKSHLDSSQKKSGGHGRIAPNSRSNVATSGADIRDNSVPPSYTAAKGAGKQNRAILYLNQSLLLNQ